LSARLARTIAILVLLVFTVAAAWLVIPNLITRIDAVSTLTWSPKLGPGEKPDLNKIRDEIQSLMNAGDHEAALQRQLWYFNHALQFGEVDPVRLSFGIMNWGDLGRRYPKARQAMAEIRDKDVRELSRGGGSFALFQEMEALNEQLGDEPATLDLFDSIRNQNPDLARQCYFVVEQALVEKGAYDTCASFIPDIQFRFEHTRDAYRRTGEIADRTPGVNTTNIRREAHRSFVHTTRMLIEILVGVGRKAEAEGIQQQALAVLNVPEFQTAVSDAEEKVRERKPAVAAAQSLSFGPVIERVIAPGEEFDLDNGRNVSRFGSGADLSAAGEKLFALDMFVMHWDSGAWELPVTEITERFGSSKWGAKSRQGRQELEVASNTYVFRTREGGLGMLQFETIPVHPYGVKIRYKLVQHGTTASAGEANEQMRFKKVFADGLEIELVGIIRNPRHTNTWWKPDGTPLPQPPVEILQLPLARAESAVRPEDEFIIYVRSSRGGNPAYGTQSFSIHPTPVETRGGVVLKDPALLTNDSQKQAIRGDEIRCFTNPPDTIDYNFSVATENWEKVAVFDGLRTREMIPGVKALFEAPFKEAASGEFRFQIMHNLDRKKYALRITARLKNDTLTKLPMVDHYGLGSGSKELVLLVGNPVHDDINPSEIVDYTLERADRMSGEFKNIALKPKVSTEPSWKTNASAAVRRPDGLPATNSTKRVSSSPQPLKWEEMGARLQKLESLADQAHGDYLTTRKMREALSKLDKAQLRVALPDAISDSLLEEYLVDLKSAKLELKILNATSTSNDIPSQIKREQIVARIADLDQQVNHRIDGIMVGLEAQEQAQKAFLDRLNKDMESARMSTNKELK
jgi:hypothetical protein